MFSKSVRYFLLFLSIANVAFSEYKKIVVVGAGLAGLTTAYRLQKLTGEPVEVYEARARVGGRVLTAYFNRSYEELGGKFINDAGDALALKALAKELELEIDNYATTISDRKYFYKGKVAPYYSPFYRWKEPDETTFSLLKKWAQEVDNFGNVLDRFFEGNEQARHLTEIRMRGYVGNDASQLSTHYVDNFWKWYQKNYAISHGVEQNVTSQETIKGGNSLLPQKLAAALKGHLHLHQPLRKISKTHDGKQFILEFPNKYTVTTDFLILTLPCSTLQDVKVQKDIIPDDQWEAIKNLQYGTNGYILLSVKMRDESKAEYSVTEDTITWFNHDQTILCLAFGGDVGDFNAYSPKDVKAIIEREMPMLKKIYPTLKYDGKKQAMSWAREEFSKGSYCSLGVGQYELFHETINSLGETVRRIFRPVENRLFFAGEHTAIDHPATMEGAVESGERTARMLAQVLKSFRA